MINNTSGNIQWSLFQSRAEEPLKTLFEQVEKKQRLSTKDLKQCLKAVKNSPLKLPSSFLTKCQEDLTKVLHNQQSKKYVKKISLIKEIIINAKVKQNIRKEYIEHPFLEQKRVEAHVGADCRLMASPHSGSKFSGPERSMTEKKVIPDYSMKSHAINVCAKASEKIKQAKKEDLAKPAEANILEAKDGFNKIDEEYTKYLDAARDKLDMMIEKYQKSVEVSVINELNDIYGDHEKIIYLLKKIPKETSATKKNEKIASLKNYQVNIAQGLVKSLDAIQNAGSATDEFVTDAKFTRDRLLYALNNSFDAFDRLG